MTTTSFTYRAHQPTVEARLQERLASLQREVQQAPVRERLSIYRRRLARTVAGAVGAVGGLLMLSSGLAELSSSSISEIVPVYVLGGALLATLLSYVVAFLVAPLVERRRMARLLVRSDEPERDLAIVERASARSVVATWAERWEGASLTMPLVAIALLGPLTLHALVMLLLTCGIDGLGEWIGFSALIVGHAHLAFAIRSRSYVQQLRDGTLLQYPMLRAWAWVTLVSAIPGALMLAIPPIITGVTGLFLIFPAFKWADNALLRERLALA